MFVVVNSLDLPGRLETLILESLHFLAVVAILIISPSVHSSEQSQKLRPQTAQIADVSHAIPIAPPICDTLVKGATNISSDDVADRSSLKSAGPAYRSSIEDLISIGQRLREIETKMLPVLTISRQFGEFIKKERALIALVKGEILELSRIRENFRKSKNLDKNDQTLAVALERQQGIIRPYESLRTAFEVLGDWRQVDESGGVLTELRHELEQLSQRTTVNHRGGSHQAKIVNLLSSLIRLEDMVSSAMWDQTQQSLSDYHELFGKLWGHQTLAVLDASKHTDRFSDFPVNHAIGEGIEPMSTTRGDLGREPNTEFVMEKSIYGYDLLFLDRTLSEANALASEKGKRTVNRKNVALLDPNLSLERISRGTVLTSSNSRFTKSQSFAVLGFFPNGDVLLQTLPGAGGRPKLKSISLKQAKQMKITGTSNINRMPLVGDVIYQPTDTEIASGSVILPWQRCGIGGLQGYKQASHSDIQKGTVGTFNSICHAGSALGGVLGIVAAVGGIVLHSETVGMSGLIAFGLGIATAIVRGPAATAIARATETLSEGTYLQRPSLLAKLPRPDGDSPLLRSDSLWIRSNSLTVDERKALGIGNDEDLFVSTIGEKLKIVRPAPGFE